MEEGEHTGFFMTSIVVTGEASELGLKDGDRGGCAICGQKDKWVVSDGGGGKRVESVVAGLGPWGDGLAKGGR